MSRLLVCLCAIAGCASGPKGVTSGSRAQAASPLAGAPTIASPGSNPIATQLPEQMVIEGTIEVQVSEIGDVVPALHGTVEQAGGRVITESVTGAEQSWTAQLKLRLPPDKLEDVVSFLAKRGDIVAKHITATDVSKQLFDEDLAIKNLKSTLDRLTELMKQGGLKIDDVLRVEQEMTRIRGQIETLEGDTRFLKDRVALATLDITMSRRAGAVTVAQAKAYPGLRAAMLVLADPGSRTQARFGAGLVLHTVLRQATLEVDVFQKEQNADATKSSAAVLATFGGAAYSDFFGHGERRFGNPYLGGRLGYGYLDSHRFVAQGELGVELIKTRYAVVDANARITGLIGRDSDLALVVGIGAIFAF